jgi:hypothetical protein
MGIAAWMALVIGLILAAGIVFTAHLRADQAVRTFLDPHHPNPDRQLRILHRSLMIKACGPLIITILPVLAVIGVIQSTTQFFTESDSPNSVLGGIILLGVFVNALSDALKETGARRRELLVDCLGRATRNAAPELKRRLASRLPWLRAPDSENHRDQLYFIRGTPTPPVQ